MKNSIEKILLASVIFKEHVYSGSLESLVNTVARAVKKHYPGIEVSEAAKKPGKG